ncbi:MAG: peptide ABC transporter substrate-binding protein, partial [Dehalococcoidia bacterium]|nr:peptide ABC transporter substrate-binding protein [Dehalococcoidia bacterium]
MRPFLLVLLITALCLNSTCLLWDGQDSLSIPQKNTLTLVDAGPMTLDPTISQDVGSHSYIMQIFSGLVALDENMEPVGDIAEQWDISDDGKTYTFHLRQDVSFHDGKKVTARDFKYSWERACHPDTESPTAPTYLNDIVGVKEMLAGETEAIEGVRVLDDYTLQVTMDAPKAYFLAKLTYPVAFVVDEANVKSGEEWWHKPNGSGPFKLKEWREDELVLLERNETYYRDKAKLSYVAFLLWGGVPMQMYERGEIDATYVSLDNLERVMDESNPLHQELVVLPELSLVYIGLNTTKPPFNDPKVRQAFCRAVDIQRLISQLLKGSVIPADGILPPGMPGYGGEIQGLDYDLEQARTLIAEAGYADDADLPPLAFTVPGEGGNVPTWLTSILWQWKQGLEVEIEVRQLESEAYLYRLDEEMDEMFFFGWVADYPDPQNFLEVLFHSQTVNNKGKYSNPDVDS